MANILVLGAYGQIARVATDLLLNETDAKLTLYLRNAGRLGHLGQTNRVRVVEGDVLDINTLQAAMVGQDVVNANLAGKLEQQARCIVTAMDATQCQTAHLHQLDGDLRRGAGRTLRQRSGPIPQGGQYHRGL